MQFIIQYNTSSFVALLIVIFLSGVHSGSAAEILETLDEKLQGNV